MDSGSDCSYLHLNKEQLREVEKTKNKLQQTRQDLSKELLSERSSDCDVRRLHCLDVFTQIHLFLKLHLSYNSIDCYFILFVICCFVLVVVCYFLLLASICAMLNFSTLTPTYLLIRGNLKQKFKRNPLFLNRIFPYFPSNFLFPPTSAERATFCRSFGTMS